MYFQGVKMHELRYFQEIHAISDDLDLLFLLKCQFILDDYVEEPLALKIYFDGKDEWLFDFLPTKEQASRIVAESCFTNFDVVQCRKGMVKDAV